MITSYTETHMPSYIQTSVYVEIPNCCVDFLKKKNKPLFERLVNSVGK